MKGLSLITENMISQNISLQKVILENHFLKVVMSLASGSTLYNYGGNCGSSRSHSGRNSIEFRSMIYYTLYSSVYLEFQ